MKNEWYLVSLGCYAGAVFLIADGRFLEGIVCMGIGTCFMALAEKRRRSAGQEDRQEG